MSRFFHLGFSTLNSLIIKSFTNHDLFLKRVPHSRVSEENRDSVTFIFTGAYFEFPREISVRNPSFEIDQKIRKRQVRDVPCIIKIYLHDFSYFKLLKDIPGIYLYRSSIPSAEQSWKLA